MLAAWTEILPLFVVRWLALRRCERFRFRTSPELRVVMARPDVLVKVPRQIQQGVPCDCKGVLGACGDCDGACAKIGGPVAGYTSRAVRNAAMASQEGQEARG